jgi:tetratricopeptide (TPR) repeat protein
LAYSHQWFFRVDESSEYIKKAVKYIDSVPEKERLYIRAQSIKDFSSRIPIYKEIINKFPNEKLAYFEVADMLYHNGTIKESIPYFEKSLVLDPSFEFSIQHLGWAYRDVGLHDKDIELTSQSLKIYPDKNNYKYNELYSYLYAGRVDDFFSKVRSLDDKDVQFTSTDVAFGDGYLLKGDYGSAKNRYSKLLNNSETKLEALLNLRTLSIYAGDYTDFISTSDQIINYGISKNNYRIYISDLARRAFTLIVTFEKLDEAEKIINEMEKIFKDKPDDVTFDDMGVFSKFFIINSYKYLNKWSKADKYVEASFGSLDNIIVFDKALKAKQNGNFKEAISHYLNALKSSDVDQYNINFDIAKCYMEINDYQNAIKHFDAMKNVTYWGQGHMKRFYHGKNILYSGLANLELKNYRIAKSKIETFLEIWDKAPESLKDKKLARQALKKINKANS